MNVFDSAGEEENKTPIDLNIIRTTLSQNGYTFLRPIGQGGFGSVFLIFSNQYNIQFVVKVSNYRGSKKNNPQNKTEFDQNEINNLINLTHPNIINMYKYFTDDHYLYIVLEYCEGGSLKDVIQKNGRIRSAYLYQYCHQILTALKHCHDLQITHNDIKPANVLIDKNQRLKLADFGLSKSFSSKLHTSDQISSQSTSDHVVGKNGEILVKRFCGSKAYMAPELHNFNAYDPFKADIWSLGVTFYEMATGRLPWNTSDLEQMRLQISVGLFSFENVKLKPELCKVIHRMLEVIPTKRPTVDWLLEQPIFANSGSGSGVGGGCGGCGQQAVAASAAMRASLVAKSPSFGSFGMLQGQRMRAGKIRGQNSFSFNDRKLLMSFSSESIPSLKEEDGAAVAAVENEKEAMDCSSPLKPAEIDADLEADELIEQQLLAKPRKKRRLSTKKLRSSMPMPKTFL